MKASNLLLSCLALLATAAAACAAEAQKVLLLDATLIEHSDNIRLAVGQAEKSGYNPLFGEDRPWEPRFDNLYPNVIWDEQAQLFKCWYNPFLVEMEDWIGSTPQRKKWLWLRDSGLCYAESADGIHWRKPALDLLPFRGQPSNILVRDVHGVGVFRDLHEANPERRYKMFFVNQARGVRTTLAVAFSPDGLHWGPQTVIENAKVMGDTHNNALWAPTLNRYVAFTRDWDPRQWKRDRKDRIPAARVVSRMESEDFEHWSEPQEVIRGLSFDQQVYQMLVFYHGGVYLGLPVIFDLKEDRTHPELAWSKDTVNWHRIEPGTPLIENGTPGSYDWGCVYPAAYPLFSPDGIKLFYAGSDGPHTGERKGYFALATLRPDGFAAATPADPDKAGVIVSTPRVFQEGERLLLTADTAATGSVQVTLLDAQGRAIARSEPLSGSFTARPVVWTGKEAQPLRGQLRLQFTLSHAKLYSYDIAPGPTGK